jgi:catechol 2,3-dioxygenase-like lactoylglutathione lyase family enzyme
VDAFWQAGSDAGYRDDGAPGPRTIYGPAYYGGFLLDPDGNSAEAVHCKREDPVPDGRVDHLWIRVRNPAASKRFYETIARHAGLRIGADKPDHVQMAGENFSFSLIDDERPLTKHVHLAFPAQDDATVRAFHAAALAAGYQDHGGPGERAVYHPGYYGAFGLDPDGQPSRRAAATPCARNTLSLWRSPAMTWVLRSCGRSSLSPALLGS